MRTSTRRPLAARPGAAVSRSVGMATGSALALALLTCGCVFTAVAGPALSLHLRTQALRQTLAQYPGPTMTVQVSADWAAFLGAVQDDPTPLPGSGLGPGDLPQSTADIAGGLAATPLPLAGGAWAGLNTEPLAIAAGAPARAQAGALPQMEVAYRDPLTRYAQVVAGSYTAPVPPGSVGVAATEPTAARFGLHPGSLLTLRLRTGSRPARLYVTAVIRARDGTSAFWQQDTTIGRPSLVPPLQGTGSPYWLGGVIADPDQLGAIQDMLGRAGLELGWVFPLDVSRVSADQAQALYRALSRAAASIPTLSGPLAPGASALTISSPLAQDLALFLGTQSAVETVLLLLFVSLAVVGAAVILLAARMVVARREGELTMLRARGGSLRQLAALMLRGTVVAAGPGLLAGAGLAVTAVPGGASSAGWPLAGLVIAVALAGPPLIAAWLHRRPAPAGNPARITTSETRRPARPGRRPVTEVTVITAAAAGLIVLRRQGIPAGGATDPFLTITPVLAAVPVVVIMLRLYPLAVRGLLALSARRAGATGFVALSRAAGTSLTGALPAFALVLSLSVATFAGMISQGITSGEITASWRATGADVLITAAPGTAISPDAVRKIGSVPGVRHAAEVWDTNWLTQFGQSVDVIAVDPATYRAVVADTPFSPFAAAGIGHGPPGGAAAGATLPVLASPAAAAVLGRGPAQLSTVSGAGPITVRVAGFLAATPAAPGGGAFVVMPLQVLPGPAARLCRTCCWPPVPRSITPGSPRRPAGRYPAARSRSAARYWLSWPARRCSTAPGSSSSSRSRPPPRSACSSWSWAWRSARRSAG